jgi:hypothetical protein
MVQIMASCPDKALPEMLDIDAALVDEVLGAVTVEDGEEVFVEFGPT